MAWRGSVSRNFINAARSHTIRRSSTNSAAFRRPLFLNSAPRLSFSNPRNLEALSCVQSLMPMYSMVADARLTSHVAVSVRACCELSQGSQRKEAKSKKNHMEFEDEWNSMHDTRPWLVVKYSGTLISLHHRLGVYEAKLKELISSWTYPKIWSLPAQPRILSQFLAECYIKGDWRG